LGNNGGCLRLLNPATTARGARLYTLRLACSGVRNFTYDQTSLKMFLQRFTTNGPTTVT